MSVLIDNADPKDIDLNEHEGHFIVMLGKGVLRVTDDLDAARQAAFGMYGSVLNVVTSGKLVKQQPNNDPPDPAPAANETTRAAKLPPPEEDQ